MTVTPGERYRRDVERLSDGQFGVYTIEPSTGKLLDETARRADGTERIVVPQQSLQAAERFCASRGDLESVIVDCDGNTVAWNRADLGASLKFQHVANAKPRSSKELEQNGA